MEYSVFDLENKAIFPVDKHFFQGQDTHHQPHQRTTSQSFRNLVVPLIMFEWGTWLIWIAGEVEPSTRPGSSAKRETTVKTDSVYYKNTRFEVKRHFTGLTGEPMTELVNTQTGGLFTLRTIDIKRAFQTRAPIVPERVLKINNSEVKNANL